MFLVFPVLVEFFFLLSGFITVAAGFYQSCFEFLHVIVLHRIKCCWASSLLSSMITAFSIQQTNQLTLYMQVAVVVSFLQRCASFGGLFSCCYICIPSSSPTFIIPLFPPIYISGVCIGFSFFVSFLFCSFFCSFVFVSFFL
ncbi:hypothetical protein EDC01DRAFT_96675 [Geopyxis carbonaria]|nr:hypothetical protein EDC01DRAFT_96675 [Geopyxis carbonaria]